MGTPDISRLIPADENEDRFVWQVAFAAKVKMDSDDEKTEREHCPDCGQDHEHDASMVFDAINVRAGDDAQVAIAKAKAKVMDPEKFGVPVDRFILKGVRLLAVAEVL